MSLSVAILAGGLATRLGDATRQTPKSLLQVAGKPFAQHQLELLCRHGFNDVVFCVGHLGESVANVLGDGSRWGMRLRYSYDGPKLLGTGGALKRALPLLGESFLILYGDAYLQCDYARIERAFLTSGKLGLMTVYRNLGLWDRSNVLFNSGMILSYDKKNQTPEMLHIDYGLGGLRDTVLQGYPDDAFLDLETVYQELIAQNELSGFEVAQRFYEIGSPAGLEETRAYLSLRSSSNPGVLEV